MTIYLYVKTHNVTGLKYLGKTSRTNPHEYQGSGIYWRSHLKKHGKDYSTEILKECKTKEELKFWGLYYSNLWNVVSAETKQKTSLAMTGKPKSEAHKRKLQEIGAMKRKMLSTPDGIFESRDAAAKFYKIKPESMGSRIKRSPDKYHYC